MRVEPARGRFIFVLLVSLAVALLALVYPVYVIRPFRMQGARELAAALAVMRWRPAIMAIRADRARHAGLLLAVATAKRASTAGGGRSRSGMSGGGAGARKHLTSLMFHPDPHPAFLAASQVKLDGGEKVKSPVKIGAAPAPTPSALFPIIT